jgi:hypothetical protein
MRPPLHRLQSSNQRVVRRRSRWYALLRATHTGRHVVPATSASCQILTSHRADLRERRTRRPCLKKLTSGAIPIDVFFGGKVQGIAFQALTGKLAMNADAANAASLGSPLNIQATFPAPDFAASGYSPMWSVYPLVWTAAATAAGKVRVLKSQADVTAAATAGDITAPDGKPVGAPGIIVNCPVMAFAATRPK